MSDRIDGGMRLFLALPAYALMVIVYPVLALGIGVLFIVDVAWQIALDDDGISEDNILAQFHERYYELFRYVAFGEGDAKSATSLHGRK